MLDANARYIPKGKKFFVEGYVGDDSILYRLGFKSGDYALCKMLDDTNDSPRISIKIKGKVYVVRASYDEDTFLTYEGRPDGGGFICDKSKAACEKLIGGFNNTYWEYNRGE